MALIDIMICVVVSLFYCIKYILVTISLFYCIRYILVTVIVILLYMITVLERACSVAQFADAFLL